MSISTDIIATPGAATAAQERQLITVENLAYAAITRHLPPTDEADLQYFVRFEVGEAPLRDSDGFCVMTTVDFQGPDAAILTAPLQWARAYRAARGGEHVVADVELRHARPLNPAEPDGPTAVDVVDRYLVDLRSGDRLDA